MIKDKLAWVEKTLRETPNTRDSNEQLYFKYLSYLGYDLGRPIRLFLQDMQDRKIPYIDSIARASRKIQEENPDLRGKTWSKRKKKEVEIREEIRKI